MAMIKGERKSDEENCLATSRMRWVLQSTTSYMKESGNVGGKQFYNNNQDVTMLYSIRILELSHTIQTQFGLIHRPFLD